MTMYSFLKKYALFGLVLGLFSLFLVFLFLVFVVKSRVSDNSVSPETERVYAVPPRRGLEVRSDPRGTKVQVTGASAAQSVQVTPTTENEDQKVLPPHHLKKVNRLKTIQARFEEQDGIVIRNPLKILEMLKLEAEMRNLDKEVGYLIRGGSPPPWNTAAGLVTNATENEEPFELKMGQLVLPNLTPDGRLPVSFGEPVVDLLLESGKIDDAATIYMATQRAMQNGDEFFKPEHLTEWGASEQGGTEASAVTTDPCCPEETTPVHLEDGHIHEPTTVKMPVLTTENIETQRSNKLSAERFDKGRQLIDEYGTEEGLRRLREMDPEAARQFGHQQREREMNTEP